MQDAIITIAVFAAIFGIVYVIFTARNRERMALIEKGINVLEFKTKQSGNGHGLLKWALLIIGLGLGVFVGSILDTYTGIDEEVYFGTILLFGGLGLFIAYLISKPRP